MRVKRMITLLLLLSLLPLTALGSNNYIFSDSNSRRLTKAEVWEWQYDALGYAFNELFARYGRPFIAGSQYDVYFRCQTWYRVDPAYPGDGPVLSNLEWDNYVLIKDVREEMRALGTTNPCGKPVPNVFDDRIGSPLPGFEEIYLKPDQRLNVYDGPGTHYRRGANGKAMCSTNGRIYAAGFEGGWMMLLYEVNTGGVRVGFASQSDFRDSVNLPQLSFSRTATQTTGVTTVTEDPVRALTPIAQLSSGTPVTWLSRYYHRTRMWEYIEFEYGGQLMRGFVPEGSLRTVFVNDPEIIR